MGNIFGQPAREKAFTATARRIASNVRNAFRQEVLPFYARYCFYIAIITPSSFVTVSWVQLKPH
jgi:hypothetical protein